MREIILMCFVGLLVFLVAYGTWGPDYDNDGWADLVIGDGIHFDAELGVTYIEGESCTVNAYKGITLSEFNQALTFCNEQFIEDRLKNR